MTRAEFLQRAWRRYPAARPGWVDVSAFVAKPTLGAIVCGRLGTNGVLQFGQRDLSIDFSKAEWLDAQSVPFSPSLIGVGDLVAVRIAELGTPAKCDRISLLVAGEPRLPPVAFTVDRSRDWMRFTSAIREHFVSRDFIEERTPTLVPSPGTEPFLDPFVTKWEIGRDARELFLPTSPEFHLKQALVAGWARVFEFKTCFRNGEIGEHHQPEFLMLEWYRAFADLDAIADDVSSLLEDLARAFAISIPKLERTTMAALFAKAFPGFTLTPATTRDQLAALAKANGIAVDASDSFDDVFFRLFLEKIERDLGAKGPLLVRGYPPSQAALSRIGVDGFADRFEVYWRGLEIANAFHELNDPLENEKRFAEDAAKKAALGKRAVPRDENLVRAMHAGMPPSGGIALGVDRLFMALMKIDDISETRGFPLRRDHD